VNRYTDFARRYGADLAALLVVTIWGINFVFTKSALDEFDPLAFTALRFLGMLALGWGILLWRRWSTSADQRVARADLPRIALAGVLGYTLYITMSIIGQSYTTAFSSALLIATAPLFTALLLWGLRAERIGPGHLLGMLISLAGVVVFLAEKLQSGLTGAGIGDLISLASAFFFAAYTVTNKPLLTRYPAPVITAYTMSIGTIPVILLALPAVFAQEWGAVSPAGWVTLGWSIVFPVYFAWTVWSWASARIGVARTAVFMYLVPIIGGLTSWLLLAEDFGPQKVLGALLTLAGLVLARRLSSQKPAAPPRVAVADRGAKV
jgi:drug/metabolite transporter (DMT)-like permease